MRNAANNNTDTKTCRVPMMAIICIASVMVGCASKRSRPLPDFETVAIQAKIRPADGVHAQADNETARKGAKIGAGGGAAAGAVYSAVCGPWFWICLPFTSAVGAVAGATAGGTAGLVSDAVDTFSSDAAERVDAILVEIEDRRDFFVEIRDGVSESIPQDRQADVKAAKAVIFVGPQKIEFVQTESSHLALRITATLDAEWNRHRKTPRRDKRSYVKTTAEMPVDYWLSNNGAAFDAGFTECIEEIVQMMAWDLVSPNSQYRRLDPPTLNNSPNTT
jgi:hypothetical protein